MSFKEITMKCMKCPRTDNLTPCIRHNTLPDTKNIILLCDHCLDRYRSEYLTLDENIIADADISIDL